MKTCVFLVADIWLHLHHLDLIVLILDYQLKRTHFADGYLVPFFIAEPNALFRSSLPVCRRLRPSFTLNKTADKITVFTSYVVARDSTVGIATRYGLDGPWIELRCG
jgi:hypothetical protein